MGRNKRNHKVAAREDDAKVRERAAEITIDGSTGEGGGQVLRMAIALASTFHKSVLIHHIRANRPNPGLRAQHLSGIRTVSRICCGITHGDELSSTCLHFDPAQGCRDLAECHPPLRADVGTAGAVALVLQAAFPAALERFPSGQVLSISGGTITQGAPTTDYVEHVLIPIVTRCGVDLSYDVVRHGFFPTGGGLVNVTVQKARTLPSCDQQKRVLSPLTMGRRGKIVDVRGRIIMGTGVSDDAGVAAAVYARNQLRKRLRTELDYSDVIDVNLDRVRDNDRPSAYCALTLWATARDASSSSEGTLTFGSSRLIGKKDDIRELATAAADEVVETLASGASVDQYMADQLVV